jgi:MFS family permease
MGGFFALAGTASLNDLFFVHERGFRVGLWNFGVIASVNLTPVISGYVISSLSWRWSLWLEALFFGVVLAAVICFFPETSFHREHREGTAVASTEHKSDQSSEYVVWKHLPHLVVYGILSSVALSAGTRKGSLTTQTFSQHASSHGQSSSIQSWYGNA